MFKTFVSLRFGHASYYSLIITLLEAVYSKVRIALLNTLQIR